MAQDFGTGVSYVNDPSNYNYNGVIFQKGKPPLDSEINLVQQLQNVLNQRQFYPKPSGWLTAYQPYTSTTLENSFYTQDPSAPKQELAVVNGWVIPVTNTNTTTNNQNVIELGSPPTTGNRVNGVFLEVWRALLDPDTSTNKPSPAQVIDSLNSLYMYTENRGWSCGENGLVLRTINGGQTWTIQNTNTTQTLNDVHFVTSSIGWVVGTNGLILRTSTGGTSWSELVSTTIEDLNGIYAYNQLVAWACGGSGTVLKTTNGVAWTQMTTGITSDLNDIYFYDNLVGWAVGKSGTIIKTTDGGTNWIQVTSGVTVTLNAIKFWDANYGFAVGDDGTILKSTDGGATWSNQSGNIKIGGSFTTITDDLNDVFLRPQLDVEVVNEEVSSQFDGTVKSCTVAHTPITKGDGTGTTTNVPADVKVTVNGVEVAVDSVNGTTGTVMLAVAPPINATVLVTYYFKSSCVVFTGEVWIVGDNGRVLKTSDVGATWLEQDPNTSYNLYGIHFTDLNKGWIVGEFSVIRHTEDGGTTWSTQQSDVVARQVQRIYKEGNVDSPVYLDDDMIHPDAQVETTKRVQIQYRIRIIDSVDPISNPESGLSSDILGLGPNTVGQYSYSNMGSTTGDYGLWRARCLNTVDGYCWAIPMFFVARRNSASYNASSNPNGSNDPDNNAIRPDMLTGVMVVDSDVLDVRRRIDVPDLSELLYENFDALSRNRLKTRMVRLSDGGDRYGTTLLQTDRVSGQSSDGGDVITGALLADAVDGSVSSESSMITNSSTVEAATVPEEISLATVTTGYSQNTWDYEATYIAPTNDDYNGKPLPGYWDGIGTSSVKFVFDPDTKKSTDGLGITSYYIAAKYASVSTTTLSRLPYDPMLVKNTSGTGDPAFWYQGVLDDQSSEVIEEWDSGISGYTNYALMYPGAASSDTNQRKRASTVEVHVFHKLISENIIGTNQIEVKGLRNISVGSQSAKYTVWTLSKLNNATGGYSYKITNMYFGPEPGRTNLYLTSASGFPFLIGNVLEFVFYAESSAGDTNIRNGATVNFSESTKGIGTFCRSELMEVSIDGDSTSFSLTRGTLLGSSTTETLSGLQQPVVYLQDFANVWTLTDATVSGFGTSDATVQFSLYFNSTFTIQLLIEENELRNSVDNDNDGLLISYNYVPHQSVENAPTSVTLETVLQPNMMYVSNLGTGGGTEGEPYGNPLEHIPVNDSLIGSDGIFNNLNPMRFHNFMVDSGFVQLPIKVPGTFEDSFTLSTPIVDNLGRAFYSTCSISPQFSAEGLIVGVPRKAYIPVLTRVLNASDNKLLVGEYLMVIFSRPLTSERENTVGYTSGGNDSIAVYRLPNKPIGKVLW